MKKILAILLVLVLLVTQVACSGSKWDGDYVSENGNYEISLSKGKVTWQEMGMVFSGAYEKKGDSIDITMVGSGFIPDQAFTATQTEEGGLLIEGGSLSTKGIRVVKKTV